MPNLLDLWLPILASGILVHIASTICWVISPHHKPDWQKLPNEDEIMDKVRSDNIPPGQYVFPCVQPSEMKDPEAKKRWEAGPWGTVGVWKGMPNMGKNIGLTVSFFLVTSVFVGYITTMAHESGDGFSEHFQVAGTAGIMAYCFAFIPGAIWFGAPLRATLMNILDGLIYGLLTGVVFGALWPSP